MLKPIVCQRLFVGSIDKNKARPLGFCGIQKKSVLLLLLVRHAIIAPCWGESVKTVELQGLFGMATFSIVEIFRFFCSDFRNNSGIIPEKRNRFDLFFE